MQRKVHLLSHEDRRHAVLPHRKPHSGNGNAVPQLPTAVYWLSTTIPRHVQQTHRCGMSHTFFPQLPPTRAAVCPTLWDSVQIPQDANCTSHSSCCHCGTVSFLSGNAGCQLSACRQKRPRSFDIDCCSRVGRNVVPEGPTFQRTQSARSVSVRVMPGGRRLGIA